ncbi:carboxypeptidase-like regulatory domain-containing protein [Rhizosphaericola mali]|uniref:carboxypeptidase-like regulatory domain-containing protein n=1 Tax=Rhizosphaericola mali TaxID=2545455 RepID=UPI00103BFAB7|nr:carboxypeptidase-like regulatory domain-containing protein [Rhizosphaericola mali]
MSQKVKINGVITTAKNREPLSGVTISSILSGKNIGMSDSSGKYKVSINDADSLLKFYHVGYASFVLNIKNTQSYNVQLVDSSSNLDEVVVVNIGYGTVRKEAITGAVSSISSKDLADFPVGTVADALSGKLAGVSVKRTEGAPGADFTLG